MSVEFDVERLIQRLGGRRVAVICTPAGYIRGAGVLGDILTEKADVRGMLAMEHGLRGDLQDGVQFDCYTDPRSGVPVFSFYGETHTFPRDFLDEVDVIVFHAQDVSHRAYTYKQTLAETLSVAAEAGVEVIVADRPTPLAHLGSRGPMNTQFFPTPLPVVLGNTLGELALWVRGKQASDGALEVICPKGWTRDMLWNETGLPWVPPSPNIPSVESVYAYACTGILQHTTVSEGRGTCKPFEYIGAPFLDGAALAAELNAVRLPGVLFREVYFCPAFNQYKGQLCAGVHLMFEEPRRVDPMRTMWAILRELARSIPEDFQTTPGFGRWLDGETWTAERIAEANVGDVLAEAVRACAGFDREMEPYRLYRD